MTDGGIIKIQNSTIHLTRKPYQRSQSGGLNSPRLLRESGDLPHPTHDSSTKIQKRLQKVQSGGALQEWPGILNVGGGGGRIT